MGKKLVYAFYVNKDYGGKITDIHFNCIEQFSACFDEMDINFILDEEYPRDFLLDAEQRFSKIFLGKNVSFTLWPNTGYREALIFYNKVAKRLKDEEMVFFAHNKGVTNIHKYNKEQIYTWVVGMYFYSLNFMDEVQDQLLNKKYYSYGPYLTIRNELEHPNKYGWYYIGTYFWLNGKKLYQYMVNENIPLPEMGDRFYAEEFPGNIIPTWPMVFTGSHGTRYITTDEDYYTAAKNLTNAIYDTANDGFNDFYSKIVNE